MKEFLSKLPIIGNFVHTDMDWHNPKYVLNVIKEKDLKRIRKKVLKEIKKEDIINPKTLFYVHKFIDSSFNKKALNIEGRFIEKQNSIDQLYALGKSEMYASISEYYDLVKEVREAEERLRNAVCELDTKVDRNLNKDTLYSDDTSFWRRFKTLPIKLDWGNK